MEKIELILSLVGSLLIVVDLFLLRNSEKENKRLVVENRKLKNKLNGGV